MACRYTLSQLEAMPTRCVSQADDLKVETPRKRVWLSRCDVANGEPYPNKVSVEERIEGRWIVTETYPAR